MFSPFWQPELATAWTKSAMAMTESSFAMVKMANESAMAMCGTIMNAPKMAAQAGLFTEPSRAEQAPAPSDRRVKSWYRAPYRSPFDPMFWLEPNGQDGANPFAWMQPNAFLKAMGQAAPIPTPTAPATSPWGPGFGMPAPFQQAMEMWMKPVTAAWLPQPAVTAPLAAVMAQANPTYRSAGGFAVAQVIVEQMTDPVIQQRTASIWARQMFPWLPR